MLSETACSLGTTGGGLKTGWQRTATAGQGRVASVAALCNTLLTLNQTPPPEAPSPPPAFHLAHYALSPAPLVSIPNLKFVAEVVLHSETEPFDRREDIGGRLRPYEGLGVGVVGVDERTDVRLQLARRGMHAPA